MKFLRVLCVLALALCVTASVYAETQSVKVSGDLTTRAIFRNQYALEGTPNEQIGGGAGAILVSNIDSAQQSYVMTVAALQVDADLTDNVTTVIRILNQRDWDVYDRVGSTQNTSLVPNGRGWYGGNGTELDVMVDLAYVQLKNFIYSPLTLTIGRQNLWFGKGFIVGANQQNPGIGAGFGGLQGNGIVPGNLSAPEYTAINSFDAVKAVLDYDPWTITAVYSKIYEDAIQADDDVDLWGINVGYKFCKYNAEAEAYWFFKQDDSLHSFGATKGDNDVSTLGARGSLDPISWVTLAGELAYQGGSYVGSMRQDATRDRSAWALDVSGEVRYFTDKYCWKPKFGAEYIYYSGDKAENDANFGNVGGTYTGWDPMYRGKYDSAIREFVGKFYSTGRYPVDPANIQSCEDDSRTNQHQIIFMGSVQPMDSLTLKANYNLFFNQYQYESRGNSQGWIGQEVDLNANWDYTEDVSFGILAGWFLPGEVYTDHLHDSATDVVGTVKVSF